MSEVQKILEQHREWMRGIRTDRLVGTSDSQTEQALYTLLMEKMPKELKARENGYRPWKDIGYNRAVSEMVSAINELFGRTE